MGSGFLPIPLLIICCSRVSLQVFHEYRKCYFNFIENMWLHSTSGSTGGEKKVLLAKMFGFDRIHTLIHKWHYLTKYDSHPYSPSLTLYICKTDLFWSNIWIICNLIVQYGTHVPWFVTLLYGNSILQRSKEIYIFNNERLISRF